MNTERERRLVPGRGRRRKRRRCRRLARSFLFFFDRRLHFLLMLLILRQEIRTPEIHDRFTRSGRFLRLLRDRRRLRRRRWHRRRCFHWRRGDGFLRKQRSCLTFSERELYRNRSHRPGRRFWFLTGGEQGAIFAELEVWRLNLRLGTRRVRRRRRATRRGCTDEGHRRSRKRNARFGSRNKGSRCRRDLLVKRGADGRRRLHRLRGSSRKQRRSRRCDTHRCRRSRTCQAIQSLQYTFRCIRRHRARHWLGGGSVVRRTRRLSRQRSRTRAVRGGLQSSRRRHARSLTLKIHDSQLTITLQARARRRWRLLHWRFQNRRFYRRATARTEKRWRPRRAVRSTHGRVSRRTRAHTRRSGRGHLRHHRTLPSRSRVCVKRRRALKRRRRLHRRTNLAIRPASARSRHSLSIHLSSAQELPDLRERRRRIARRLRRRRLVREPRRPRRAADLPDPPRRRRRTRSCSSRTVSTRSHALFLVHRSSDVHRSILLRPALEAVALVLALPKESTHQRRRYLRRAPHRRRHLAPHLFRVRRRRFARFVARATVVRRRRHDVRSG